MNNLKMSDVFDDDVLYLIHALEETIICSSQGDEVQEYADMHISYNTDLLMYEAVLCYYIPELDYNSKTVYTANGELSITTLNFYDLLRLCVELGMHQKL